MKINFNILLSITPLILCPIHIFSQSVEETAPVINARQWNYEQDLLALSGQCLYYKNQLVDPNSRSSAHGSLSKFPTLINDGADEKGVGYGTFYLRVAVPDLNKTLALHLPQMYSSYKLWVNDSLLIETGKVAKTKEESKPKWLARTISFESDGDTIDLLLQISNFHHAVTGIKENIILGTEAKIMEKQRINIVANLSEVVILMLIGLVFILAFIFSQQKGFALYFALLTITWAVRSLFSNQYLYAQYNPEVEWTLLVRIEYITLFLTVIWGTLAISNLYKEESNVVFKYFLVGSNVIFITFTIAVEPREFSQWLTVYLGVAALLLIYAIIIAVRAITHRKAGIYLLATSILIAALIFGYDMAVFKLGAQYNPVVFSLGYISIFVLIGFNLGLHINILASKSNDILS